MNKAEAIKALTTVKTDDRGAGEKAYNKINKTIQDAVKKIGKPALIKQLNNYIKQMEPAKNKIKNSKPNMSQVAGKKKGKPTMKQVAGKKK